MPVNLNQIATQQERELLRTFTQTIQSVKDQATIAEIVRLLEVGNVDGVIELLQLEPATFEPIEEAIRQSYRTGGLTGAGQIGGIPTQIGTLAAQFNIRSLEAERWLRDMSSRLITEVFDDQKEMVRERLLDGLQRGAAPRQTALDLVGRVDPTQRKRIGGFIGLHSQQAERVDRVRDILSDPERIREYFIKDRETGKWKPRYKTTDRRFDSTIIKAIKEGRPIPQDQLNKMVTRMQDKSLKVRGELIARNESLNALRAGQWEAMQQAIAKGEVESRDVTKTWDATGDARTRLMHLQMEQTYGKGNGIPINQNFVGPDGSRLRYPGDTSLGATGEMSILCRCKANYAIDFIGRMVRMESF